MTPVDDRQSVPSLETAEIDAETAGPPADDLFRALANETRRRLLAVLTEQAAVPLDDLTDVLVGWETTDSGSVGPDEWARVKIELVHAHVPLLVDAGLVDYDADREEVRLAPLAEPVCDLLRFSVEYERAVGDLLTPEP